VSAQVQFFCSSKEEREILVHLTRDLTDSIFRLDGRKLEPIPGFSPERLPPWPASVHIFIWPEAYGPLAWHSRRPEIVKTSHRDLVRSLFAQGDWDGFGLTEDDALLDQNRSPLLQYSRGEVCDGRLGPSLIFAPPNDLEGVSVDYARWVRRCLGWVRRRATKVHDWKTPSPLLPSPRGLLNTIYAFPEAYAAIESKSHTYAIL
jgi:hypothetical protein